MTALLLLLSGCSAEQDSAAPSADTAADCALTEPAWGSGGEDMLPGLDCLDCHREGGRAANTPFTVAGTVFVDAACPEGVPDATVEITDAEGTMLSLPTSALGNFYSDAALEGSLFVRITTAGATAEMEWASGACNQCHSLDGANLVWVAQ